MPLSRPVVLQALAWFRVRLIQSPKRADQATVTQALLAQPRIRAMLLERQMLRPVSRVRLSLSRELLVRRLDPPDPPELQISPQRPPAIPLDLLRCPVSLKPEHSQALRLTVRLLVVQLSRAQPLTLQALPVQLLVRLVPPGHPPIEQRPPARQVVRPMRKGLANPRRKPPVPPMVLRAFQAMLTRLPVLLEAPTGQRLSAV